MAKRMNPGRYPGSGHVPPVAGNGRFGTARSPRGRACGSGHGQEQRTVLMYPARDDGDDDPQPGLPRRRGSPTATGHARGCARPHRHHGVRRRVGGPGRVGRRRPRCRAPVARAGEARHRSASGAPAGRNRARRDPARRREHGGGTPPAVRRDERTHDDLGRWGTDVLRRRTGDQAQPPRRGRRQAAAGATEPEPQASNRTGPFIRTGLTHACR